MYLADLITVITPMYDREKFIGDTIQSCLEQTHPSFEMIVVDDGSNDYGKEVVEKFCVCRQMRGLL